MKQNMIRRQCRQGPTRHFGSEKQLKMTERSRPNTSNPYGLSHKSSSMMSRCSSFAGQPSRKPIQRPLNFPILTGRFVTLSTPLVFGLQPYHDHLQRIVVAKPSKPLEYTPKGTARRALCLNLYAAEIEEVYQDERDASLASGRQFHDRI